MARVSRISALFGGALVLLLGVKSLGACDEVTTHFLVGQLFEPARGCLDPEGSIAQVDGPVPDQSCAATCVVGLSGQNGNAMGVYVTTMCAPYPAEDDTTGTPAGCSDALAAFARGDTCLIDGDSSAPVTDDDAGDDADEAAAVTDARAD